jgi:wyosine [tRNA(Phe)-imidazoG37] synthetase (radical SAM superfamily)
VDLVPYKTCTYDCVYCQLGPTTTRTCRRRPYVSADCITAQLASWLERASDVSPDYVTLSGCGEPTLNSGIGDVIRWLKDHTDLPVAVLTNGSLLALKEVRQATAAADLLLPSLDAGRPGTFRQVNRPSRSLRLRDVVDGLVAARQEAVGEMWLEVMLVAGLNDHEEELHALRRLINRIQPHRVQINTVVRPPTQAFAGAVGDEGLGAAQAILGPTAEAIAASHLPVAPGPEDEALSARIVELLRRRPCTVTEIAAGLGGHPNAVVKHLERLLGCGDVRATHGLNGPHYVATHHGTS